MQLFMGYYASQFVSLQKFPWWCPYHPLLLHDPALDNADPLCHVYVEEGEVLCTTRAQVAAPGEF